MDLWWLFWDALLVGGIVLIVKAFGKRKNTGVPTKTPQYENNVKQSTIGPSSDILETIRLYKEIKNSWNSIDKYERIRRCNCLLTDFEWYTDLSRPKHNEEQANANWKAMYDAVFENDVYYEGDRYNNQSMSDICLEIIEKYTKH